MSKTQEDLWNAMMGKLDGLFTEITHIKEDNKELRSIVAEIDARTRPSKIEGEGHENGTTSTNNLSNLTEERDSHKESSELPKSSSINNKTTEIWDINPETTISTIENDKSWDIINLRDEEKLSMHQRLIDCYVARNDTKQISTSRPPISSNEALTIFTSKLKTMKDAGYFDPFILDSKSTSFTQCNTKDIFLELYQIMVKAQMKLDSYHLAPIGFLTACIAASGGFNFSEPKHASILSTLAIDSKIYLDSNELCEFTREVKHAVFLFLTQELNWDKHYELGACETLRDIINIVENIETSSIQLGLKLDKPAKDNKGNITLNAILDNTANEIDTVFKTNDTKRFRFTQEDTLWVEESFASKFDKLTDDSLSIAERLSLKKELMNEWHNKNHVINDFSIYFWYSKVKLAVHDEKVQPKMTQYWIELNKELEKVPTLNPNSWSKAFFLKHTELSKTLRYDQVYNLMQVSFQQANSKPLDQIPDFKFPINHSLNAAVTNNHNRSRQTRKKVTKSSGEKSENLSSNQQKD